MRSTVILFCSVLLFSCGNQNNSSTDTANTGTVEMNMEAPKEPIDPKTHVDPVCGMEWDNEWTDMTVYKGDTMRFCGEGCKMAFEARPQKYVK